MLVPQQSPHVKIGIITTSYPRFAGDGAGSFVAGHVGALRALGHDVEVIAAGDPGQDAVLRVGGGRLFYRGGAPDALERAPIRAGASAAVFTARLTATVVTHAPRWDLLIAHWLVPSAIAALPSATPLIAIAHGGDVFTLRRLHLVRPVFAALHRRHARLVFVSHALQTIARDAAPALASWLDAATVQPMGIDLARFAALRRAPGDPPIVLVVARLVPIKGVDVAIMAMHHVQRDARLVIAGDGPERDHLATPRPTGVAGQATTRRASHAATARPPEFLGAVTTQHRDELLAAASVVVIPSRILPGGRTEGTPAIALEALAAGVPVIASAVGGLGEVPGVRLVPPDAPDELARAIDQMLAHPPSAESLRAGVAGLDWREVAPRLLRE
jgi:glycosyltransferase involved in cell wall biosynthesis